VHHQTGYEGHIHEQMYADAGGVERSDALLVHQHELLEEEYEQVVELLDPVANDLLTGSELFQLPVEGLQRQVEGG